MPEALTHGVLPWRPTDRARHALLIRFGVAHNGGPANNSNNSTVRVVATSAHNYWWYDTLLSHQ